MNNTNIKLRLTVLQFLEFFIWGSWLISFGGYLGSNGFSGMQIGLVYGAAGIASILTPGIVGMIADRWINSERLLGILHLLGACCLFFASRTDNFSTLYALMFCNALVFMPTIALSYSVSYSLLSKAGLDSVKAFPPIRAWGTVGFIIAMWIVDLLGWTLSSNQLWLASASALLLGCFAFTLPPSPPARAKKGSSWVTVLGFDAFALLKQRKMAVFFLFAVLIGICLQITNAFGTPFIQSFGGEDSIYKDTFVVEHSNIFLSISQISEALFILAIPFFLRKYGIKTIMLMSLGAWVLRFGLFAVGDPGMPGVIWLTASMIIYGMAFDFFNISGSLFVENESPASIRSSAQGMFMMATNGLGAVLGTYASGAVIDHFTVNGVRDWSTCWFIFAGYAAIIGILFAIFFKHKGAK